MIDTAEFISRAKKIHGTKYGYDISVYLGMHVKIDIRCKKHGIFKQAPHNHLRKQGCAKCSGNLVSRNDFILRAKKIHGVKYSYAKVNYVNAHTKITILCKKHGYFSQTPNGHLNGNGCPECVGKKKLTTDSFISKSKLLHGNKFLHSKVHYTNISTPVILICREHGDFLQTPNYHLNSAGGCPHCNVPSYSQLSIKWIEGYAYSHRLKNVQHALNGGEFTIPGTRIRVDGFHRASNTIFEFHGDDWHGNPNKHKPMKKCHPHSNKNAKQLYRETLEREKEIKRLGYNLIIMWESDYKQRLKRWVTHETRYCLKFSQHVPNSKL